MDFPPGSNVGQGPIGYIGFRAEIFIMIRILDINETKFSYAFLKIKIFPVRI